MSSLQVPTPRPRAASMFVGSSAKPLPPHAVPVDYSKSPRMSVFAQNITPSGSSSPHNVPPDPLLALRQRAAVVAVSRGAGDEIGGLQQAARAVRKSGSMIVSSSSRPPQNLQRSQLQQLAARESWRQALHKETHNRTVEEVESIWDWMTHGLAAQHPTTIGGTGYSHAPSPVTSPFMQQLPALVLRGLAHNLNLIYMDKNELGRIGKTKDYADGYYIVLKGSVAVLESTPPSDPARRSVNSPAKISSTPLSPTSQHHSLPGSRVQSPGRSRATTPLSPRSRPRTAAATGTGSSSVERKSGSRPTSAEKLKPLLISEAVSNANADVVQPVVSANDTIVAASGTGITVSLRDNSSATSLASSNTSSSSSSERLDQIDPALLAKPYSTSPWQQPSGSTAATQQPIILPSASSAASSSKSVVSPKISTPANEDDQDDEGDFNQKELQKGLYLLGDPTDPNQVAGYSSTWYDAPKDMTWRVIHAGYGFGAQSLLESCLARERQLAALSKDVNEAETLVDTIQKGEAAGVGEGTSADPTSSQPAVPPISLSAPAANPPPATPLDASDPATPDSHAGIHGFISVTHVKSVFGSAELLFIPSNDFVTAFHRTSLGRLNRRIDSIRNIFLFNRWSYEKLSKFSMQLRRVHFPPNCTVYSQGDLAQHVYFLESGELLMQYDMAEGRSIVEKKPNVHTVNASRVAATEAAKLAATQQQASQVAGAIIPNTGVNRGVQSGAFSMTGENYLSHKAAADERRRSQQRKETNPYSRRHGDKENGSSEEDDGDAAGEDAVSDSEEQATLVAHALQALNQGVGLGLTERNTQRGEQLSNLSEEFASESKLMSAISAQIDSKRSAVGRGHPDLIRRARLAQKIRDERNTIHYRKYVFKARAMPESFREYHESSIDVELAKIAASNAKQEKLAALRHAEQSQNKPAASSADGKPASTGEAAQPPTALTTQALLAKTTGGSTETGVTDMLQEMKSEITATRTEGLLYKIQQLRKVKLETQRLARLRGMDANSQALQDARDAAERSKRESDAAFQAMLRASGGSAKRKAVEKALEVSKAATHTHHSYVTLYPFCTFLGELAPPASMPSAAKSAVSSSKLNQTAVQYFKFFLLRPHVIRVSVAIEETLDIFGKGSSKKTGPESRGRFSVLSSLSSSSTEPVNEVVTGMYVSAGDQSKPSPGSCMWRAMPDLLENSIANHPSSRMAQTKKRGNVQNFLVTIDPHDASHAATTQQDNQWYYIAVQTTYSCAFTLKLDLVNSGGNRALNAASEASAIPFSPAAILPPTPIPAVATGTLLSDAPSIATMNPDSSFTNSNSFYHPKHIIPLALYTEAHPSMFGDLELLSVSPLDSNSVRLTTVRTLTPVTCYMMDKGVFFEHLKGELWSRLQSLIRKQKKIYLSLIAASCNMKYNTAGSRPGIQPNLYQQSMFIRAKLPSSENLDPNSLIPSSKRIKNYQMMFQQMLKGGGALTTKPGQHGKTQKQNKINLNYMFTSGESERTEASSPTKTKAEPSTLLVPAPNSARLRPPSPIRWDSSRTFLQLFALDDVNERLALKAQEEAKADPLKYLVDPPKPKSYQVPLPDPQYGGIILTEKQQIKYHFRVHAIAEKTEKRKIRRRLKLLRRTAEQNAAVSNRTTEEALAAESSDSDDDDKPQIFNRAGSRLRNRDNGAEGSQTPEGGGRSRSSSAMGRLGRMTDAARNAIAALRSTEHMERPLSGVSSISDGEVNGDIQIRRRLKSGNKKGRLTAAELEAFAKREKETLLAIQKELELGESIASPTKQLEHHADAAVEAAFAASVQFDSSDDALGASSEGEGDDLNEEETDEAKLKWLLEDTRAYDDEVERLAKADPIDIHAHHAPSPALPNATPQHFFLTHGGQALYAGASMMPMKQRTRTRTAQLAEKMTSRASKSLIGLRFDSIWFIERESERRWLEAQQRHEAIQAALTGLTEMQSAQEATAALPNILNSNNKLKDAVAELTRPDSASSLPTDAPQMPPRSESAPDFYPPSTSVNSGLGLTAKGSAILTAQIPHLADMIVQAEENSDRYGDENLPSAVEQSVAAAQAAAQGKPVALVPKKRIEGAPAFLPQAPKIRASILTDASILTKVVDPVPNLSGFRVKKEGIEESAKIIEQYAAGSKGGSRSKTPSRPNTSGGLVFDLNVYRDRPAPKPAQAVAENPFEDENQFPPQKYPSATPTLHDVVSKLPISQIERAASFTPHAPVSFRDTVFKPHVPVLRSTQSIWPTGEESLHPVAHNVMLDHNARPMTAVATAPYPVNPNELIHIRPWAPNKALVSSQAAHCVPRSPPKQPLTSRPAPKKDEVDTDAHPSGAHTVRVVRAPTPPDNFIYALHPSRAKSAAASAAASVVNSGANTARTSRNNTRPPSRANPNLTRATSDPKTASKNSTAVNSPKLASTPASRKPSVLVPFDTSGLSSENASSSANFPQLSVSLDSDTVGGEIQVLSNVPAVVQEDTGDLEAPAWQLSDNEEEARQRRNSMLRSGSVTSVASSVVSQAAIEAPAPPPKPLSPKTAYNIAPHLPLQHFLTPSTVTVPPVSASEGAAGGVSAWDSNSPAPPSSRPVSAGFRKSGIVPDPAIRSLKDLAMKQAVAAAKAKQRKRQRKAKKEGGAGPRDESSPEPISAAGTRPTSSTHSRRAAREIEAIAARRTSHSQSPTKQQPAAASEMSQAYEQLGVTSEIGGPLHRIEGSIDASIPIDASGPDKNEAVSTQQQLAQGLNAMAKVSPRSPLVRPMSSPINQARNNKRRSTRWQPGDSSNTSSRIMSSDEDADNENDEDEARDEQGSTSRIRHRPTASLIPDEVKQSNLYTPAMNFRRDRHRSHSFSTLSSSGLLAKSHRRTHSPLQVQAQEEEARLSAFEEAERRKYDPIMRWQLIDAMYEENKKVVTTQVLPLKRVTSEDILKAEQMFPVPVATIEASAVTGSEVSELIANATETAEVKQSKAPGQESDGSGDSDPEMTVEERQARWFRRLERVEARLAVQRAREESMEIERAEEALEDAEINSDLEEDARNKDVIRKRRARYDTLTVQERTQAESMDLDSEARELQKRIFELTDTPDPRSLIAIEIRDMKRKEEQARLRELEWGDYVDPTPRQRRQQALHAVDAETALSPLANIRSLEQPFGDTTSQQNLAYELNSPTASSGRPQHGRRASIVSISGTHFDQVESKQQQSLSPRHVTAARTASGIFDFGSALQQHQQTGQSPAPSRDRKPSMSASTEVHPITANISPSQKPSGLDLFRRKTLSMVRQQSVASPVASDVKEKLPGRGSVSAAAAATPAVPSPLAHALPRSRAQRNSIRIAAKIAADSTLEAFIATQRADHQSSTNMLLGSPRSAVSSSRGNSQPGSMHHTPRLQPQQPTINEGTLGLSSSEYVHQLPNGSQVLSLESDDMLLQPHPHHSYQPSARSLSAAASASTTMQSTPRSSQQEEHKSADGSKAISPSLSPGHSLSPRRVTTATVDSASLSIRPSTSGVQSRPTTSASNRSPSRFMMPTGFATARPSLTPNLTLTETSLSSDIPTWQRSRYEREIDKQQKIRQLQSANVQRLAVQERERIESIDREKQAHIASLYFDSPHQVQQDRAQEILFNFVSDSSSNVGISPVIPTRTIQPSRAHVVSPHTFLRDKGFQHPINRLKVLEQTTSRWSEKNAAVMGIAHRVQKLQQAEQAKSTPKGSLSAR